jgi:dolichol-phosphate mannosyltransferase
MSLESNLQQMERAREAYWLRYPNTAPFKLHWRALAVRHSFHILPGESILELGAGTGLWTEYLASVLRGQNPITAAVFNDSYLQSAKKLPNVDFVQINDLRDLPAESFDYIVGNAILCHDLYPQNLQAIYRLLKPGGQILFFEANYWNPQVFLKSTIRPLGRWAGNAECQVGMHKYLLMKVASQQGFVAIDIIPYDIIHPRTRPFFLRTLKSLAFVLEHAPLIKDLCGTLYIWARKPGDEEARRPQVSLAEHEALFDSTSFVIPCHNEEMNIGPLTEAILRFYGPYVHEILIVNDNSRDRTAEVTREIGAREPRVKLVDRTPPNGVGRALRDGIAAATGRYILTMDCDFIQILPEFRDLFDAIARGRDGAIGSRFSQESLLINYPFMKIVCNRAFHVIANMLLPGHVRDVSNNLKLYRAEIYKTLKIEQTGFAANAETGLKPLMNGYDICEVPISWINRTIDMGVSSFRTLRVAPGYANALSQVVRQAWRDRRNLARASERA